MVVTKMQKLTKRRLNYRDLSSDDEDETHNTEPLFSNIVRQIQQRAPSPNGSQSETVRMDLDLARAIGANELNTLPKKSYDKTRPYIYVVNGILLLITAITATLKYESSSFWDSCVIQRFDDMLKPLDNVGVANVIAFRISLLIVAIMLVLFVFGNDNNRLNRLYHVLFTGAWYYCTWNIVTFLKVLIGDISCNKHANSVSGHFNFYVFSLLSLFFLNSRLMPYENKWKPNLRSSFHILFAVYGLASGVTLYETMFLGYHSPRQGLYGITLGVTSHVVYSILLQQLSRNRKTRNARYMKYSAYVVAFCVLSVTMNIWYELANKHRVQWIKMLPSTILTTLCVATGFVIANYTN